MSLLTLAVLTLVPFSAALVGARRIWPDSPVERLLGAWVLWVALLVVPVHALGWLGLLGRASVAATALVLSAGLAAWGLTGGDGTPRTRGSRALATPVRVLRRAYAHTVAERSLVTLGLLAVPLILVAATWLSYLAPSGSWDGLIYHEPMVGFALENGGFETALPTHPTCGLQLVDAFPRMAENLTLWFVAFWDRRVIELGQILVAPILLLSAYLVFRRFVASATVAVGMACGLFLMPAVVLQLRSTLVDVFFASFVAAALFFTTRGGLRARDVWMAGLCLGLALGSKVSGLFVVPVLGAVALARIGAGEVAVPRRRLAVHAAGAIVLLLALGAPTFVRNALRHDNPLWPGALDVPSLGVAWTGPCGRAADQNRPFDVVVADVFGPPKADMQNQDDRYNGYGNAPPYVVLPLAVLGLLGALFRVGTAVVRRDPHPGARHAANLLLTTVPLSLMWVVSPARDWARLNLPAVLAAFAAACWVVGPARRRLLGEGVVAVLIVMGLVTLWWSKPGWKVPLAHAAELARMTPTERAASDAGQNALMPTRTALARERELGPGDTVVFTGHPFPGTLFNEAMSNRVVLLSPTGRTASDWLAQARALGARWVVVPATSPMRRLLDDRHAWQRVGPTTQRPLPAHFAYRYVGGSGSPARAEDAPGGP